MKRSPVLPTFAALAIAASLVLGGATGALAAHTLRVGKAQAGAFTFVPLDVGIEQGFFANHGLDVQSIGFFGDAKVQQAMAAGSIDIAIGGGPTLAFVAKGAPELGIAAMAGRPYLLTFTVQKDGPIHKPADLKGRIAGVSTVGSLAEWLVRELSRQQGWGPNGIHVVTLGSPTGLIAALRLGQIDGFTNDVGTALEMQQEGLSRILVDFGDIIPEFITHVIFASNAEISEHPEDVRAFLAGWFDTIRFIRGHKTVMVTAAVKIMHISPEIASRTYDIVLPMFSNTGRFDPKALEVLAHSFVEMKILSKAPDMSTLYTERFLPASAN